MICIIDYSGKDNEEYKKPDYLKNLTWQELKNFIMKMQKDAIKDTEQYYINITVEE